MIKTDDDNAVNDRLMNRAETHNSPRPVLLVDDDPKDVEFSVAVLETCECIPEVVVAKNGSEALDYLYARGRFLNRLTSAPAVVLLDMKLPGIGGIEVLQRMKTDPLTRMTPVVMLTGTVRGDDVARSDASGANGFAVKNRRNSGEALRKPARFWISHNQSPPVRPCYEPLRTSGASSTGR